MNKPMPQSQLDEIQARCEAATPGPWESFTNIDKDKYVEYFVQQIPHHPKYRIDVKAYGKEQSAIDSVFIAHAREDIPVLLAEVKRLREAQRWIPVAERLPDADGHMVLALVNGKPHKNITLHSAYMLGEYNADEGWILSEYPEWIGANVTHWMPLPEPPERSV